MPKKKTLMVMAVGSPYEAVGGRGDSGDNGWHVGRPLRPDVAVGLRRECRPPQPLRLPRARQPAHGPDGSPPDQRMRVLEPRLGERRERRIIAVAHGNQHVAEEPGVAEALHRGAGEEPAEAGIVEADQLGQRRRGEVLPGPQPGLARGGGKLVPGADGEAVVAAVYAVAHGDAELVRNRPVVLVVVVGK